MRDDFFIDISRIRPCRVRAIVNHYKTHGDVDDSSIPSNVYEEGVNFGYLYFTTGKVEFTETIPNEVFYNKDWSSDLKYVDIFLSGNKYSVDSLSITEEILLEDSECGRLKADIRGDTYIFDPVTGIGVNDKGESLSLFSSDTGATEWQGLTGDIFNILLDESLCEETKEALIRTANNNYGCMEDVSSIEDGFNLIKQDYDISRCSDCNKFYDPITGNGYKTKCLKCIGKK